MSSSSSKTGGCGGGGGASSPSGTYGTAELIASFIMFFWGHINKKRHFVLFFSSTVNMVIMSDTDIEGMCDMANSTV